MLKVVAVVDKTGTALDRLAKGVAPYHDNLDYVVCDVHPKRPDPEQIQRFEEAARTADIIDFQYFRTAQMLVDKYDWLKEKTLILTHNNPYSIYEQDWHDFDRLVANNKTMLTDLKRHTGREIDYISLATEPNFWEYNLDWQPNKRVLMVANRIEAKKGIIEVAIACGDLGLTFVLVGAVSDPMYFHSILQTGTVEFHEQISDEELRKLYHTSSVLVCNSVDDFESGTLPVLEAMQCGTPVLTRNVGHIPDLNDGKNMKILPSEPNNIESISTMLTDMLNDKKELEELRGNAWNTAKGFNMQRRAYEYQRLYRSTIEGESVSVIVPIFDKPDTIRACLNAISNQTHKNIEIIVCDETVDAENKTLVAEISKMINLPVKYIHSGQDDYGLARARNMGIIAATGDVLVFCDQRMIMEEDAVQVFLSNLIAKAWLFGKKGVDKDAFVENFSCVARTELIEAGMFNERITQYGGMSQEIRARTRAQGFSHRYIPEAKCNPMGKSSKRNRKRKEIIAMKDLLWKVGL